jgi:hypothetical protein
MSHLCLHDVLAVSTRSSVCSKCLQHSCWVSACSASRFALLLLWCLVSHGITHGPGRTWLCMGEPSTAAALQRKRRLSASRVRCPIHGAHMG